MKLIFDYLYFWSDYNNLLHFYRSLHSTFQLIHWIVDNIIHPPGNLGAVDIQCVMFVACSRCSVSAAQRTSGKKARGFPQIPVILSSALFPFRSPPQTKSLEQIIMFVDILSSVHYSVQLKERTFQQIEEVNKSFMAVHNTLLIKTKSPHVTDSKVRTTEQQSCDKVIIVKKESSFVNFHSGQAHISCVTSSVQILIWIYFLLNYLNTKSSLLVVRISWSSTG